MDSKSKDTFEVKNPVDDSVVVSDVQAAGEEDVDLAVDAAAKAFKGEWSKFTGAQRQKCMLKFADLLDQHTEEIAKLETLAMGMPIGVSKQFVAGPAGIWRYYAGWCDKIAGEMHPEDGDNTYKIIRYEPIGVCAGICAWNATLLYTGWKIAPAVAAGNTFIFKTSEKSPLGALYLGNLVKEAGFPAGVINFVSGAGKTGGLLASHMKISKIGFTGSITTGRIVQQAATKSNLKKCTLELGGKSASLVFNDADLDTAVTQNSQNFLLNSGQVCIASSRTLVQEGIAPKFIEALKTQFQNFSHAMGDTLKAETFLGPLADKKQFESVMGFLEQGRKEGVEVLAGGGRKGDKGNFVEPTLLLNPSSKSKVYTDEIFGPVLAIKTFKTEEEAIEMANHTTYGLGATLYTSDVTRALRVSAKLEAGSVSVNAAFFPGPNSPFGGVKQSGIGREGGKAGLMAYLETKVIHINMAAPTKEIGTAP